MSELLKAWQGIGAIPPADLRDARLQLHWAAQIPGAAGRALAPPEDDDGHTSLSWRDGLLISRPGEDRRRVGLDLAAPALVLIAPDGEPADRLELAGSSLNGAFDWTRERLGAGPAIRLADYELPPHPVADGAAFSIDDPATYQELARWYGNASLALEALRLTDERASAVRCWPHHFDLAILVPFDPPGGDPETSRSVGLGLSPGDDAIPEPYWYATPWPPPPGVDLPSLDGGGFWLTDPFTAGVLRGADLAPTDAAEDQAGQVMAFLRSGRLASARLLGAA